MAINQCIRTEAEAADDAVLLAVHEPIPLLVREAGTGIEEFKSEKDLLGAFLTPADDGSAVVVAITGDSGVGKSHMIRWLHAQLQRNPSREKFVIVLVPKTASLRQVVELMLDGTEYDTLRQELSRVTDSLGPVEASRHLATTLTIELEAREAQWIAEPGRFFAAPIVTLQVPVIGVKARSARSGWIYTVAESVYGSFSNIPFDGQVPTYRLLAPDAASRPKARATIFGRTCDSADCLAEDIELPELRVGDLLEVPNMGAYTTVSATTFNGFPKTKRLYGRV
jgi:hypothetical protein